MWTNHKNLIRFNNSNKKLAKYKDKSSLSKAKMKKIKKHQEFILIGMEIKSMKQLSQNILIETGTSNMIQ